MDSVSDAIRICFTKTKKKQTELARRWQTSPQAISNKFYRDYWSADELVDLARFFSAKLIIKFPDGIEIPITTDQPPRSKLDEQQDVEPGPKPDA